MSAPGTRWWRPRPMETGGLTAALAAAGLAGVGVRVTEPVEFARRLRRALGGLDPVVRGFGLHLASRIDLLPPVACRELAKLPADGDPLPADRVAERLEAELGRPVDIVFAWIDPLPMAAGPFRQRHRARTAAGDEVEVVLARPECLDQADPRELAPLGGVLDRAGYPGYELLAEYRRRALEEIDVEADARALEDLAAGAADPVPKVAQGVERALTRGAVLVQRAVPGVTPQGLVDLEPPARAEAVRRLALEWLRQVFFGHAFPLSPEGSGCRLTTEGRVVFVSGPFKTLPAASRTQLWRYLEAGVVDDLSTASERLLPELVRDPDAVPEEELLLRLRQVVALREGELGEGVDPFSEHLFATLRVARESGYRVRRPVDDVVRGLAGLTALGTALSPGSDPVRGALEELRLQRTAGDLRHVLDPGAWADLPAPHAALLLEMPRKLEAVLDLLSSGEARVRLQLDAPAQRRGSGGAPALAAIAVATALVLAAPRLADLLGGGSAGNLVLIVLATALVASLAWR